MPATLTIGDFAKATHLTVKTLRHYHRVGLLAPVEIDEETGYRRYGPDQIAQALVIRRFRALDMPLDDIRDVLAAPDVATRNAVITAHLERLEAALAHTRTAAESLRGLLGSGPGASPRAEIEHLSVPATPAAAITGAIDLEDGAAGAWMIGAFAELRAALAAQQLPASGPVAGIFSDEVFADARGEATLFVPYGGPVAFRAVGRAAAVVIPEAELATTVHLGPHETIDQAYGALAAHVARHALGVPGAIREYYLADAAATPDPERWRTRIGWPIFQTAT